MSVAFSFALEYSGDRRVLRDYFYACKCTYFWTGPMTSERGPPDAQAREHYAMHNNYNLIDLLNRVEASVNYRSDVRVVFTFNKGAHFASGAQTCSTPVSAGWLARRVMRF